MFSVSSYHILYIMKTKISVQLLLMFDYENSFPVR